MGRKGILFIFGIAFLIICSYGVFATTTFTVPIDNGNYSTPLNITLATDVANATNATCYYNASGGEATVQFAEILNDTGPDDISLVDAAVDISGLPDTASTYNLSCQVEGGGTTESVSLVNVTIDNTAPNVSTFYTTLDGTVSAGVVTLNVSVSDALMGIDSVYFNITNSSGVQDLFVAASNPSGAYYNATFNTSAYAEGLYTITVYANDTQLNNLNNSKSISVTGDRTGPAVSLALSESSSYSLTITVTGEGTCTVDRSLATLSGSGITRTLTEAALGCGQDYAYVVTCTDTAGNVGTSASTTFTTNACDSGSSGGGSTTPQWTNTYVIEDTQFEQGYTNQLSINNRVKVKVDTNYHYVGVKEISTDKVTVEIASDPIEVILAVGEEAKVDVTNDGMYDIYVLLNAIVGGKADLTIKEISEAVPEGEGDVATTGEIVPPEGAETPEDESRSYTWLWIIGIVILVVVIYVIYTKKK